MRSSFALLLFVSLPGCLEGDVALFGCPPDEVCSEETPNGLFFVGAGLAGTAQLGNSATAVGGTQRIALQEKIGSSFVPLTAEYVAIGGSAVAVESKLDHVITLRGQTAGHNDIVIRDAGDDTLMDRKDFAARELASIAVVGDQAESTSELPAAFLPGTLRVGIALRTEPGLGGRLVDESMEIELPGSTRVAWDLVEISGVEVGTLPITVTAAGTPPVTLDITVVAQAEAIVDTLHTEDGLVAGEPGFVCFHATAGETHRVVNLDWSITGEEVVTSSFFSKNCALFTPEAAGEVTLTASAGGLTKIVTYPVAEAPREKPRAPSAANPFAGELAALRATAAASRSR